MQLVLGPLILLFGSVTHAHAYIDPGSGSVIVTTVLGLIAAVGYTFRKYYFKLKNYLVKGKEDGER